MKNKNETVHETGPVAVTRGQAHRDRLARDCKQLLVRLGLPHMGSDAFEAVLAQAIRHAEAILETVWNGAHLEQVVAQRKFLTLAFAHFEDEVVAEHKRGTDEESDRLLELLEQEVTAPGGDPKKPQSLVSVGAWRLSPEAASEKTRMRHLHLLAELVFRQDQYMSARGRLGTVLEEAVRRGG